MTHDYGADQPLDAERAPSWRASFRCTREVADKYPTVRDAVDCGRFHAGPFFRGWGRTTRCRGLDPDRVIDHDDRRSPQTLIYDGLAPDAPLAGFMYYSLEHVTPPEGFAGPNDHWHYHANVCIVRHLMAWTPHSAADTRRRRRQCEAVGGKLMPETP